MTTTDISALLGLIFGLTGTIISCINYINSTVRGKLDVKIGRLYTPGNQINSKLWLVYSLTNIGSTPFYVSGIGHINKKGERFNTMVPFTTQQLPYRLESRQLWHGAADPENVGNIKEFLAWDSTGKYFKLKGRKAQKCVKEMIKQIS